MGVLMAIAFARVTIYSRSKGHSAVAASAYRTGTRQTDERTGIVYDFTHRNDVIFKDTLLPSHANEQFLNRELLWNQVESSEKRIDSQVCKDIVLALPKELDLIHQIELTKRFATTHFVVHGIPADIALHDHGDGNPHAHILVATRRLENESFSKYKARDLNPAFYSGKVMEHDYWGDQWRDLQNDFFKEKDIDLTVDLNHLVPERHEGRIRDSENNYLKQDNELIREQRIHIALNHVDNLINHISITHSVFTRRDIERLVFKTLEQSTHAPNQFIGLVEKIIQHKDLVYLGINDAGQKSYTTRNQYIAEAHLLDTVEQLSSRKGHISKQSTKSLADLYQLNEEQREALDYIATGSDLSVIIGRPGVGKSYLLKPVKEYYEAQGYRVLGASLSGKVAKALQAETGINSYTLSSLNYRLQHNMLSLNPNDIIVIDEAGMIDFTSLSSVIESANKAKAKVILVGDPDQLKPINKGELFRAITSYTGYMELTQIRRQKDLGDRAASLMLSKGEIRDAIAHYYDKGAIHFSENSSESAKQLVHDWQVNIVVPDDIKENVMFAFTKAAVASLNMQARDILKEKSIVDKDEFIFYRSTLENDLTFNANDKLIIQADIPELKLSRGDFVRLIQSDADMLSLEIQGRLVSIPNKYKSYLVKVDHNEIPLAQGDRVLFRKNNSSLGVRNGDMAFIQSIDNNQFTAKLDSGELVTIPKSYKHIDYSYATTVHKGQGMTVNNSSILIDSQYWDRFLSFVAMTRHRLQLSIYADKHQHPDLDALNKTLARSSTKDNVIDWPLNLAIRNGFESDSLIGRVINHLAGLGEKIKEKYNYIVHYEAYARHKMVKAQHESKQQIRNVAQKVAAYLDEQSHYSALRNNVIKQEKLRQAVPSTVIDFKSLYEQSLVRDKKAYVIWTEHQEQLSDSQLLIRHKEGIQKAAKRHERYLIITDFAKQNAALPLSEKLIQDSDKIDWRQDKIHIMQLAPQFNKSSKELWSQIQNAQRLSKKRVFDQLKKDHPILLEFEKLFKERSKLTGLKAEQLDKLYLMKVHEITTDKTLYTHLQRDFPNLAQSLLKIKNHGLGIEREN
jgi:Ti-type conjugative transfer relaxase TraA